MLVNRFTLHQEGERNLQDARLASDTERIVRRHLQDPNHIITEEEMRAIRVGVLTPYDEHHKDHKQPN